MSHEHQTGFGATTNNWLERRSIPRLEAPFPALVRGRDLTGRPFEEETKLANLSAHGLYVRLARTPVIGDTLFVLVRFALGAPVRLPGLGVAVHGVVLRAEPHPDGRCGVALVFLHHRLLLAVQPAEAGNGRVLASHG